MNIALCDFWYAGAIEKHLFLLAYAVFQKYNDDLILWFRSETNIYSDIMSKYGSNHISITDEYIFFY